MFIESGCTLITKQHDEASLYVYVQASVTRLMADTQELNREGCALEGRGRSPCHRLLTSVLTCPCTLSNRHRHGVMVLGHNYMPSGAEFDFQDRALSLHKAQVRHSSHQRSLLFPLQQPLSGASMSQADRQPAGAGHQQQVTLL